MTKTERPDFEEAESSADQLIEIYEEAEEQADGFMAEQDADMKLTTLKSIKRDMQRWQKDE